MTIVGQYIPGASFLHRLPPAVKLLGVAAFAAALTWAPAWWQSLPALGLVLALYAAAGLPGRSPLTLLRALALVGLAVGVFQFVVAGWRTAVDVLATLAAVVLAAGLVSLTTTATAMTDVVVAGLRPLRRWLDPERVGLLISLSLRSVPVVLGLAEEIRDAQRARGIRVSPRTFVVPLLIRSLRHGQRTGEALIARGFDD